MKLHGSVIEKIVRLYETYGGTSNETKLRAKLQEIDLTPYEQKLSSGGKIILVDTRDYEEQLKNIGPRK